MRQSLIFRAVRRALVSFSANVGTHELTRHSHEVSPEESGRAAVGDERAAHSELAAASGGASRRWRREEADTAGGAARKKPRSVCPHQRKRSQCKECGGASICQHQRIRSKCKECRDEADTSMPAGLEELAGPAHAAGKDL